MAVQNIRHSRFSTLPGVTSPGSSEYVLVAGSYIQYVTNNAGERVPPAVMAHGHGISDVTGLQTALEGKAASTHTHSLATTTVPGFMSAADKVKLDASVNYVHPTSGVTAGTYRSVTVNALGHVTGGTNPTTLAGYGITDRYVTINPTYGDQIDNVNDVDLNGITAASVFVGGNMANKPVTVASGGITATYNRSGVAQQTLFDYTTQDAFYYRRKNTSNWYAWEQVASRSWVESKGFLSSAYTLQDVLNAGNSSTGKSMSITGTGGSTLPILRVGASGGYFDTFNGTTVADTFLPTMRGTATGASSAYGIAIIGQGQDTYSQGAVYFSGRNAAGTGEVTSGNLVTFRNYTSQRVGIGYDGSITASGVISAVVGNSTQWSQAFGWGSHAGMYATISHTHDAGAIVSGTLANARLADSTIPVRSVALGVTDLNTQLTPGFYHQTSNAGATSGSNYPIGKGGSFAVFQSATGGFTQQYTSYHDGSVNMYFRGIYQTNIGAWRRVWSDADFSVGSMNNWNTAYGWGNHAGANYYSASNPSGYITASSSNNLTNKSGSISMWTNDVGYLGNGRTITINGVTQDLTTNRSWTVASGVTQVGLVVPTGFTVTSSPVTGSGNISFAFSSGYSLVSSADRANWNAAGGVSGSGASNYNARWNSSNNALTYGRIFDDGSSEMQIYASARVQNDFRVGGTSQFSNSISVSGNVLINTGALRLSVLLESQLGSIAGLEAGMLAYVSSGSGHGFWGYYGSSIGWRILATRVWSGGGGAP